MGLGLFSFTQGYKGFAPTELLKNLKDILKDSLSFKSRSSNVESYKGQFKGNFVL